MKKYFSAILLGSLFSCSLFSIGITDEPDTLIDCSSEPDVMSVEYESYDRAHEHYLVHLTWTDHAGNEWSQRGRLAKFKNQFHEVDKRRLIDLRSFDKKQIFYFLSREEPVKIKAASEHLMPKSLSSIFEYNSDAQEGSENDENDEDNASEIDGAAPAGDASEDTVEFHSGGLFDL